MRLPKSILILSDTPEAPVAHSLAAVLSILLGIHKTVISRAQQSYAAKFPRRTLLVLSCLYQESHIGRIAGLRFKGFSGAVLILSRDSFGSLMQRHAILRWAKGSHDICAFPFTLPTLLETVASLEPMATGNLRLLRKELKAPDQLLRRHVIPCLERLQQPNMDLSREIGTVVPLIHSLCAGTRVACHTVVKIGGRSAQIQEHFHMLVKEIRNSKRHEDITVHARLLCEVFEQWRDILLDVGEMI